MSPSEILDALADVLATVAGVERSRVALRQSFAEDLGIDSLTMAEVVVMAEDRLGMLIQDDAWAEFRTVVDAVRYIAERTGTRASSAPQAR